MCSLCCNTNVDVSVDAFAMATNSKIVLLHDCTDRSGYIAKGCAGGRIMDHPQAVYCFLNTGDHFDVIEIIDDAPATVKRLVEVGNNVWKMKWTQSEVVQFVDIVDEKDVVVEVLDDDDDEAMPVAHPACDLPAVLYCGCEECGLIVTHSKHSCKSCGHPMSAMCVEEEGYGSKGTCAACKRLLDKIDLSSSSQSDDSSDSDSESESPINSQEVSSMTKKLLSHVRILNI